MSGRNSKRTPSKLQVEFRSPTALLIAYSVNLSRGGMFLQCSGELPARGDTLELTVCLPSQENVCLEGVVSWQRVCPDKNGPRGVGIRFEEIPESLDIVIDELILNYSKVHILVLCQELEEQKTLSRMLKSIITSAEIHFACNQNEVDACLSKGVDLFIADTDEDEEFAMKMITLVTKQFDVPCIALRAEHEKFFLVEVSEILNSPPKAKDLRKAVLMHLSSPKRVTTPLC